MTLILTALSAVPCASTATALSPNSAKGSLVCEGATAELQFAGAFINQKDERKPLVLLLADQKLPVEEWKSSLDIMMHQSKWNGIVFFLDKEENVFRTDVHMKGEQTGVSGIFELKIDNPASKDLSGTAKTKPDEKETKLDVTFHAVLK